MSKKINYSLQFLLILFISSLSIQKFGISSDFLSLLDSVTLLSTLSILGITLMIKKAEFRLYFEWYDLVYYLFLLSVLVSALVNRSVGIPYYLRAFLMNYLVLSLAVRNIPEYLNPKVFLSSFIISYIPLVASHLIYNPNIRLSSYQGLFGNPNTFGMFMSTITIVLFALVFSNFDEKRFLKTILYLILSLFSFYLVVISASRTAFLAVSVALLLASGVYLIGLVKTIDKRQRKLVFFLSIILLILLYLLMEDSFIVLGIKENIINKFVDRIQHSTLLAGRERIWKYYLENSYLFRSDIQNLRKVIGLSPHSAFIEVISRFGRVSGFFYGTVWLVSIKNLIDYSIRNLQKDKYLPFYIMAITSFVGTGMMEIVTYHPLMYIAMYASSMILIKKNEDIENTKAYTLAEIKNKIAS